jgi:hypothetical protein
MPEATVVIDKVVIAREGTSARGPWKLWHVFDKNETRYSTFNKDQAELAGNLVGRKAKLTFEETDKGLNLKEIAGPLKDDEPPTPGTGNYVKGKTNPDDERSINARRALQDAVAAMTHTIPTQASPKAAWENHIGPMYEMMKLTLNEQSGVANDKDVPF